MPKVPLPPKAFAAAQQTRVQPAMAIPMVKIPDTEKSNGVIKANFPESGNSGVCLINPARSDIPNRIPRIIMLRKTNFRALPSFANRKIFSSPDSDLLKYSI